MKSDILTDELQLWGFESDHMVFDDGSIGAAIRITPLDVTAFSDEQRNALAGSLIQFLNSLPSGLDLQFVCDIRDGNEDEIATFEAAAGLSNNDAAKSLALDRAAMFRDFDRRGYIPKFDLHVFIRKPLSQKLADKPKLLNLNKKFPEITSDRLKTEISYFERTLEDLTQGIRSLGLTYKVLTPEDTLKLIYQQWNPTRKISLGQYDPEDLRESLCLTDVSINQEGFSIGNIHHRVLSLKILPEATYSCLGAILQGLPFGSRLFFSVQVPDQTKEIESLKTQRRIAFSMARGKRSGVSDIESEAKLQDLETLLEQMIASGEKVFRLSLNVLLKSANLEELDDKVNQALIAIRSLGSSEAMQETIAAFDIFSQMALPNARSLERAKRVKTSNLADLLPIYGAWTGTTEPSILLRSQSGALLKFDPFDSEFTNSNMLISGGSGSGKSFLTNILLMQMLKENPKIFFVDIGGSYKKLCENLEGQYIPLGVSDGICINPFDLPEGEEVVSNQKIKFLVGLIELMSKEEDVSRLPKLERAELEDAIQEVYRTSKNPRLSDLREILLNHKDQNIVRYGKILTPWCGDSLFGKFLDQKTNISLTKQVVAFDLKGMETFPELQAVCLFLITDLVWREVQKDRLTKKFLCFDECWKLLKSESGIVFIEEVFRTFRKYKASAIAISQDIDDFAKSKIAGALLPNCSIKWLLLQQQVDGERLKEVLDLNDNEVQMVKSLYQEKGKLSQAFLLAQKNRIVAVVESTPVEYWIATTDPRDLACVDQLAKDNPEQSHIQRLKQLAQKYPHGVAAFEKERAS
jgi:conjugal transfer ATP-binding protein TraC